MTPRTLIELVALAALFLGAATLVAAAPPPDRTVRRAGEAEVRPRAPEPAKRAADGASTRASKPGEERSAGSPRAEGVRDGGGADRRLPIESGPAGASPAPNDRMLLIPITTPSGCPLPEYPRVVERLLGLENESQLLSLELWGDTDAYVPFQKVIYYLRAPRPMYVTLFWVGPRGDIFVPFQSLKIPAQRDVQVDPASVVVPPLGHERWVAVATLEPTALPCGAPEAYILAALDKMLALPHAIGRWEVLSKP